MFAGQHHQAWQGLREQDAKSLRFAVRGLNPQDRAFFLLVVEELQDRDRSPGHVAGVDLVLLGQFQGGLERLAGEGDAGSLLTSASTTAAPAAAPR